MSAQRTPKPNWLKVKAPSGSNYLKLKKMIGSRKLNTVCEEARCPNIGECWQDATATLMLLGDTCTRGCRFCAVKSGNPRGWLDPLEPQKAAETVSDMSLAYVVLTTVDRDDLPDGGAGHLANVIREIRRQNPSVLQETLLGDFQGQEKSLQKIADASPDVFSHNIETVERLTPTVRDARSGYRQSLNVLETYKTLRPESWTKSSIMLGLGETDQEIAQALKDLRDAGADFVTLGQYLQPTVRHLKVESFVTPEAFDDWKAYALSLGFRYCASGPLVRSSYKAAEFFIRNMIQTSTHRPSELPMHGNMGSTQAR